MRADAGLSSRATAGRGSRDSQKQGHNGLIETMMMPKDGMRDVIDEVIGELQGLRDDLRIVAKASGLQTAFGALFGSGKRK